MVEKSLLNAFSYKRAGTKFLGNSGFAKSVVVTNTGSLSDVVLDGKIGYMVKTQNSEKLAEVIVSSMKVIRKKNQTSIVGTE